MSIPPPLPHDPSRNEPMADAFGYRGAPPSAPPPKQGMSGCAIAVIIGGVLLVFGVFIAGILAAIAIPAYNDYLLRSKVASAEWYVRDLQGSIDLHRLDTGECPENNAAIGLDDPQEFELGRNGADLTGQGVVRVGENGKGQCTIELTFANVDPKVDGKTAIFESGDNAWDCRGGTVPSKYRSPQCRSGDASANASDSPPDTTTDNAVSP